MRIIGALLADRNLRGLDASVGKCVQEVTKYSKSGGSWVCRLPGIKYMFNDHFSSVGNKIKQQIPYQTGNFKDYLNKRDAKGKLFINTSNNSLFLSPTVPMEVEKIIDGLDMKKATGPNSIPNIILKSFKLFFSP